MGSLAAEMVEQFRHIGDQPIHGECRPRGWHLGLAVSAQVQADQAAADLRVAQARAERRRAAAVAREQKMRALVEENRAKVVLAEAEIPLAMSQAFREGKLGVMDYYGLKKRAESLPRKPELESAAFIELPSSVVGKQCLVELQNRVGGQL